MTLVENLKLIDGLVYAGQRRAAHEELCTVIAEQELRALPIPKLEAAREALAAMERVYLRAAGFQYVGEDEWIPPPLLGPLGSRRYRYSFYRTGQAINALKYWGTLDDD